MAKIKCYEPISIYHFVHLKPNYFTYKTLFYLLLLFRLDKNKRAIAHILQQRCSLFMPFHITFVYTYSLHLSLFSSWTQKQVWKKCNFVIETKKHRLA